MACAPDSITAPNALEPHSAQWQPARVPGTAAASLLANGSWSLEAPPRRFDADDWWYCTEIDVPPRAPGETLVLGFDGLATLAEIWLDGDLVLRSENMFTTSEVALDAVAAGTHRLAIRFLALDTFLKKRRPRPRWRAPMIENQQLRWARTTVLGRTPGWSPPAAAVGPWKPVWIEVRRHILFEDLALVSRVAQERGALALRARIATLSSGKILDVRLRVTGEDGDRHESALTHDAVNGEISGELVIEHVRHWWPHTHGSPATYAAQLIVQMNAPEQPVVVELGSVGFRTLELDTSQGEFALRINDVPVFCRGACWTPIDAVTLTGDADSYRALLERMVAAGFNMVRIAGTMIYEDDAFLSLCDSLGVLVWQEFMFANMDYPENDAGFLGNVEQEARQQLQRWQAHPSLAVLCGNSEVGQQASMWGAARELWHPPLFTERLRQLSLEFCPEVPYSPSSTYGGAFPHQVNSGPSSYYGVGAYLRPLEDARRSEVKFASECLAFANVPEPATVQALGGATAIKVHHPRWKERTPRDLGAGWDFEDVRDHYLTQMFQVDPVQLRTTDHERYLELSRVVSGEVMAATFSEWRRSRSTCRGALIWVFKDLWPGAGWGILDSNGTPKAPYYYLKRCLQPISVSLSDEGNNGVVAHVINEQPRPLLCRLELSAFRHFETRVATASRALELPPASAAEIPLMSMLEHFMDLSYAYRFGPPGQDLVVATMYDPDGALLSEAFFFPVGLPTHPVSNIGLSARAQRVSPTEMRVQLCCERFAQSVRIETAHGEVSDQYFHLAPQARRDVSIRVPPDLDSAQFTATVAALNCAASRRIEVTAT